VCKDTQSHSCDVLGNRGTAKDCSVTQAARPTIGDRKFQFGAAANSAYQSDIERHRLIGSRSSALNTSNYCRRRCRERVQHPVTTRPNIHERHLRSTKKLSSRKSRVAFSFSGTLLVRSPVVTGLSAVHISIRAGRPDPLPLAWRHMISSGAGGPIRSMASQVPIAWDSWPIRARAGPFPDESSS